MEGAEIMTNEQTWMMWETFRTITRMAKTKDDIEAEIDRIIEAGRTNPPKVNAKK